jgi:hypothetical protein
MNNINFNNAPEMFNRVTLQAKDGANQWRKAERSDCDRLREIESICKTNERAS